MKVSQSLARWRSLRSFELDGLAALAPNTFPPADGSSLAATPLPLGGTPRPPAAAPGWTALRDIDLLAPESRLLNAPEAQPC
jgi:hypothetical protein